MSIVARVNRRSVAAARSLQAWFHGRASVPAGSLGATLAAALRPFTTAERALPIAVAAIVAVASLLALLPSTPAGATGATQGSGTSPRYAVNGGIQFLDSSAGGSTTDTGLNARKVAGESFQPINLPGDVNTNPFAEQTVQDPGLVSGDGTLVTGYAPATTVEDGSSLIQIYKVRSGDTLSTIASHFKVSMMTLWWANSLKSKDALHIGQLLRIPPVNGLVVTVAATDTVDSLAARYHVASDTIVTINQLSDPTLVVGQVLIVPGAMGAPIPTPKPTPAPKVVPHTSSRSGSSVTVSGVGGQYTGGRLLWPVIGGNNYISQYYHYGHWAIDIAADYGSTVVAAAGGRVTFAGWKSNGGGWQVWISHGGDFYTTYNHLSAITVGSGQYVSRGTQVGRIGMSGDATGPHLHFETWIGPIWNGGQRMNPLNYL